MMPRYVERSLWQQLHPADFPNHALVDADDVLHAAMSGYWTRFGDFFEVFFFRSLLGAFPSAQ